MPFALTYEAVAMLLVELVVLSSRQEAYVHETNQNLLAVNLEFLEEIQNNAQLCATSYNNV